MLCRCPKTPKSIARLSHSPTYLTNQTTTHKSPSQAFYLSSGTCVVIGETARLGDDVTIMQGVTLGGNGKERGDRHPKLGQCLPLPGCGCGLSSVGWLG